MLRCIADYRSNVGVFAPGEIIHEPELATYLLNDSPESFEVIHDGENDADYAEVDADEERAVEAPPRDRMQRGGRNRDAEPEHVMTPDNVGAVKLPEHRTSRRKAGA